MGRLPLLILNQSFLKPQTLRAAVCSTSPQCACANIMHDKSRPMKNCSSLWLSQQASQFKNISQLETSHVHLLVLCKNRHTFGTLGPGCWFQNECRLSSAQKCCNHACYARGQILKRGCCNGDSGKRTIHRPSRGLLQADQCIQSLQQQTRFMQK